MYNYTKTWFCREKLNSTTFSVYTTHYDQMDVLTIIQFIDEKYELLYKKENYVKFNWSPRFN